MNSVSFFVYFVVSGPQISHYFSCPRITTLLAPLPPSSVYFDLDGIFDVQRLLVLEVIQQLLHKLLRHQ